MKNRVVLFIFPRLLAGLLLAAALPLTVTPKATAQTFANVPIADLPGVYQGKVAWGDYDNDGRLDFLITGYSGAGISQLWRNTGSGFTNVPIAGLLLNIPDAVAWGDYDNDGWLDFLNTGFTSGAVPQLWRNTGSGFTNVSVAGLAGFQLGEVAWADYDRDGRLDFLITGLAAASNPNHVSQLWRNTGNGFTQVPIAGLPGVWDSSVAWGDYDNDGGQIFCFSGGPPPMGTSPNSGETRAMASAT